MYVCMYVCVNICNIYNIYKHPSKFHRLTFAAFANPDHNTNIFIHFKHV